MKLKLSPIVTKQFPSGAIEVSDIIGTQLVRQRFLGFTKRGAIRAFRIWANEKFGRSK
jgi:hypothetical protein